MKRNQYEKPMVQTIQLQQSQYETGTWYLFHGTCFNAN